jgi:hypothetical protein
MSSAVYLTANVCRWYGLAHTTPQSRNVRTNRVVCASLNPVTFRRYARTKPRSPFPQLPVLLRNQYPLHPQVSFLPPTAGELDRLARP